MCTNMINRKKWAHLTTYTVWDLPRADQRQLRLSTSPAVERYFEVPTHWPHPDLPPHHRLCPRCRHSRERDGLTARRQTRPSALS